MHPTGGKVTRVNESKGHKIRVTEEQVLAWNNANPNYLDTSNSTKIGDSSPFNNKVSAKGQERKGDNLGGSPSTSGGENVETNDNEKKPKVNEGPLGMVNTQNGFAGNPNVMGGSANITQPNNNLGDDTFAPERSELKGTIPTDVANPGWQNQPGSPSNITPSNQVAQGLGAGDGYDSSMDLSGGAGAFEKQYNDFINRSNNNNIGEVPNINNELDSYFRNPDNSNGIGESKQVQTGQNRISEEGELTGTVLHDFGKHPSYQKKDIFTLPANSEVSVNGARDWNDKSVAGDSPYGESVGNTAPFDNFVDVLTDIIINKTEANITHKIAPGTPNIAGSKGGETSNSANFGGGDDKKKVE
jgi:hypothetical protein